MLPRSIWPTLWPKRSPRVLGVVDAWCTRPAVFPKGVGDAFDASRCFWKPEKTSRSQSSSWNSSFETKYREDSGETNWILAVLCVVSYVSPSLWHLLCMFVTSYEACVKEFIDKVLAMNFSEKGHLPERVLERCFVELSFWMLMPSATKFCPVLTQLVHQLRLFQSLILKIFEMTGVNYFVAKAWSSLSMEAVERELLTFIILTKSQRRDFSNLPRDSGRRFGRLYRFGGWRSGARGQ